MKKSLIIIILPVIFTTVVISVVWAHHYFVLGLNPLLPDIFLIIALLIFTGPLIFLFRKLSAFLKSRINLTPSVLFLMGIISTLTSTLISQIFTGNSTFDIHLHDTYFIISRKYIMVLIILFFGIFSAIYYFFPKIFKRHINYPMGYVHFWISIIVILILFWPMEHMNYESMSNMPRRYVDYSGWKSYSELSNLNRFIHNATILLLTAQALFIFNFIYSILKGKKV